MNKRKFSLYLLGVSLLVWVIARSDTEALLDTLSSLNPLHVAMLIALQGASMALIALQWMMIGRHMGIGVPYKMLLSMNMAGTFIESVTPAVKHGGEAAKVFYLKARGMPASDATAIMVAQKTLSMLYFTTLFAMCGTLLLLSHRVRIAFTLTPPLWGGILGGLGAVLIFYWLLRHKVTTKGAGAIVTFIRQSATRLRPLASRRHWHIFHTVLGLCIWGMYGMKVLMLFWVFSIDLSWVWAFVSTFSAYIVGMLPITPGGVGTFEGTFTQVMGAGGIQASQALSVVLTLRIVTFWFSLALSALWLLFNTRNKEVFND